MLGATMLVVLILLSSYARHYFFLFDDFALVELARTQTAGQILSQPLIGYYRPLPFLLLRAEWFIFGWDHPAAYLGINLLFHVVNAGLCAWLTWLVLPRTRSARIPTTAKTGAARMAGSAVVAGPA